MGSSCAKQAPDLKVTNEIDGNTCFDDLVCPSTCCVIIANSDKAKLHNDLKQTQTQKEIEKHKDKIENDKKIISPNNI